MLLSSVFFNDTATTEIYTLSLHDALPIWHILAKIYCDIAIAIGLVGGDRSTAKSREDVPRDRFETTAIVSPLVGRLRIDADHLRDLIIMAKIKCAVFADDTIDRPHACDVIAPSGR